MNIVLFLFETFGSSLFKKFIEIINLMFEFPEIFLVQIIRVLSNISQINEIHQKVEVSSLCFMHTINILVSSDCLILK
jgi:hypothetical protein